MLETLRIQNFALIENLTLKVKPGLTVITGETGSGKSTLINALRLIQGERASSSMIRTGAEQAHIEAIFDLSQERMLNEQIKKYMIKDQKKLKIIRILQRNGKNHVLINDIKSNTQELSDLMNAILEVSGQHEHHHLRRSANHLDIVDQAGKLEDFRDTVEKSYFQLSSIDEKIANCLKNQETQSQREDFLQFQFDELSRANIQDVNEDEKLHFELIKLKNAEKLRQNAQKIDQLLYTGNNAALERLKQAMQAMQALSQIDQSLSPYLDDLSTAYAMADDVSRSVNQYVKHLSSDPQYMQQQEDRLTLLKDLKRKYGGNLLKVLEQKQKIQMELEAYEGLGDMLIRLQEQREIVAKSLKGQAEILSKSREHAAKQLCLSIERELKDLGMNQAKLEVQFEQLNQGCQVDDVWIGPRGLERASLAISANTGEPLMPLQKVASGGELSRITLAIKRVIAAQDPVVTYIFDEVDSGVGGPTAEALGKKLRAVSTQRQVLCITHLPQIAAMGHQHLFVSKQVSKDRTYSTIKHLKENERIEEISRMLGGTRITDTTRANAIELLTLFKNESED
jgi:DNA repair protein RecN (Recombination protein N)